MLNNNDLINIAKWAIKNKSSIPLHDKYWLSVMTDNTGLPFDRLPYYFESSSYEFVLSYTFEVRRVDQLINLRVYCNPNQ